MRTLPYEADQRITNAAHAMAKGVRVADYNPLAAAIAFYTFGAEAEYWQHPHWIKASDRLPPGPLHYASNHLRVNGKKVDGYFYEEGGKWFFRLTAELGRIARQERTVGLDCVEWLEENNGDEKKG